MVCVFHWNLCLTNKKRNSFKKKKKEREGVYIDLSFLKKLKSKRCYVSSFRGGQYIFIFILRSICNIGIRWPSLLCHVMILSVRLRRALMAFYSILKSALSIHE